MAEIVYTESYIKRARKFIKKHPDLLSQYEKTLKLLLSGRVMENAWELLLKAAQPELSLA